MLPEWIDYNGHMNLAYYTVLFDQATDLLFDVLGLGLDYRRDTQMGTFVAETHNRYERELLVGATNSQSAQPWVPRGGESWRSCSPKAFFFPR